MLKTNSCMDLNESHINCANKNVWKKICYTEKCFPFSLLKICILFIIQSHFLSESMLNRTWYSWIMAQTHPFNLSMKEHMLLYDTRSHIQTISVQNQKELFQPLNFLQQRTENLWPLQSQDNILSAIKQSKRWVWAKVWEYRCPI